MQYANRGFRALSAGCTGQRHAADDSDPVWCTCCCIAALPLHAGGMAGAMAGRSALHAQLVSWLQWYYSNDVYLLSQVEVGQQRV